jgi:hypothetical protein
MGKRLFIVVAITTCAAALAFGQEPPPNQPDQDDPPSRAARLSFLSGTVTFQPASVEDWVPATLNRPLTTGDRLWTEAGSRAEMNLGSAALRLNGRTNFTFINLNDNMTQVQVSSGSLSVRLRRLDDQESFEIDTPQTAFSLLRSGEYRVDVNEQGDATLITVRGGQGEATADNQVQSVRPRQQLRISETGDGHPAFDERDAPVADGFDNFCQDRDRREDRSESARHVSRDMPGYADLDANGTWREDPQYGWIWAPRVEVGWAPYHHGHWAWIAPWGWTWVDEAPWGYAPFHYGRWAFAGAAWVWIPGPVAVRPVYAPALVAWVGGPRFGVGISVGGGVGVGAAVGWFPLGPGEVWTPAYRASPRYFNQVNVSNTMINRNVNITNVYNNTYVTKNVNVTNVSYANQHVTGAVMAVPQNAMGNGRPVAQAAVAVPANQVASAQVQQAPMVAPQRSAVMGGATPGSAAPPAAVMNRTVVARATPPPAPVPFAQQQSALQANPGQPLPRTQVNQMQRLQPLATQPRPMYRQAQSTPAGSPATGQTNAAPLAAPRNNPPVPTQPNIRQERAFTPNPTSAPTPASAPPPAPKPDFTRPVTPVNPPVRTNETRPFESRPAPVHTNENPVPRSQGESRPPRPVEQRKQPKPENKREEKKKD